MNSITPEARLAILARMVKNTTGRPLGRTQVMKLLYFLQELKGIQLGYDFRLFNFGPFDSEVLSDISSACGLEIVVEETVFHANGYGYAIKPGKKVDRFDGKLDSTNRSLISLVDDVVREFGGFSASELELRSTIHFVDREFAESSQTGSTDEIVDRVRQIKSHFETSVIRNRVTEMSANGYLQSIENSASAV